MKTIATTLSALLVAATLAVPTAAQAQQYPNQTIKFVVGFPPGGTPDVFLRHFTQRLAPMAGQPVIVENKPGAGGMVAAQSVATAKPDGYTVLFAPDSTPVGNMFLFKTLTYNPEKDLVLVAPMFWNTFLLVVNPEKTKANTVAELTAALKAKGGKALYAFPNSGAQMMGEAYKVMAGFEAQSVAFKATSDALQGLFAGEIDYMFVDVGAALAPLKAGKLKALAVSSKRRPVLLPDVPTMASAGFPDFDLDGFFGAYLPSSAPADVRAKLNGWLNDLGSNAEIKQAIGIVGAETFPPSDPASNDKLLTERRALWAKLVKMTNIQPQ